MTAGYAGQARHVIMAVGRPFGPIIMGRKTLPPSTSLPAMGEIADVNTASLGVYLHCTKVVRRQGPDGRKASTMNSTATFSTWRGMGSVRLYFGNHTIPDRSPPGSTRTAPSAVHHDGGVKYAICASAMIRGRDNITIGT